MFLSNALLTSRLYTGAFFDKLCLTTVPEDTATGTAVLELSVTDADEFVAELDFFITGGDPDGQFLVHASGEVST